MRRGFARSEEGTISATVAMSAAMMLGFAALAVDMGSVYLQTRQLQGMADLAALAAARDLNNAQAAAEATARANGWRGALVVTVTPGAYDPDPAKAAASRFTSGGGSPNAVRVKIAAPADLFFGQALLGKDSTQISRTATAARADLASFSLGTRLASLNGGVANALLSGLTGSTVNLSVMDYNALAAADIDLFSYMDYLAIQADVEGLSYDRVLASDVSSGDALTALADLLDDDGKDQAATAIRALAKAAGDGTPAQLDQLLDLGPYAAQDHLAGASGAGVAVSALDLSNAVIQVSNGGRQVQVDLGTSVPGLADVDAWLAIGERPNNSPWMTVAGDGSVVIRSAQMRLYVEAKVKAGSGLLSTVAQLKLPLYVEAASAEARLSSLDCSGRTATVAVKPSLGDVWIGEINKADLNDFKKDLTVSPGVIASGALLTVTGTARAELGGETWQTVKFTAAEIKARTIKTVSTGDLAAGLAAGVAEDLSLKVSLLGLLSLTLDKTAVGGAVSALLTAAAPALDGVINTLTDLAGVHLGEADVRVNGLRCKEAALVA